MIRFDIPGPPVGKGRARSTAAGHHYTPAKTRDYERTVKLAGNAAMGRAAPLGGALCMTLQVRKAIPKSWSARMRQEALSGRLRPIKRPDLSNVLKAIEDGLNGVCYDDDSQIVDLQVSSWYAVDPGVTVEIRQWWPA